jgi:uncharacterized protein YecT (DUF1311 family)
MTITKRFSLLALPLLTAATATAIGAAHLTQAQPAPQIDCENASDTPSINYCAGLFYEEADKALNQTYQQLQSTLGSDQQEKLVAAQRAWIEYRDKNCDFEVRRSIGGTGYPAYLSGCLERMTEKRTIELQRLQAN